MNGASPSFDVIGSDMPGSPVLLSVPHGGRLYPHAMLAALRVPPARLAVLEDRHADTLARAARGDEWTVIARHARAWIDLNRGETERDPLLDDGARPGIAPALTPKVRSGLGLVPRRTSVTGDIWRRRLGAEEVSARIHADHRPYHAALATALAHTRARFGIAVLLDLHSMPPLGKGGAAPRLVVGDRFGRSAAARFAGRIEAEAERAGIAAAANTPYPGGHILERHGDPSGGIHAIQLEVDRSLYLDAVLDAPGPGFARTARVVRAILTALADEALAARPPDAIAAE